MHLVQILLPLHDNARAAFPAEDYEEVRAELAERFGGLTVHTRAPAEGLWKQNGTETSLDDIVIFEVMADELNGDWWRKYRDTLESRFRQKSIMIRAHETRLL